MPRVLVCDDDPLILRYLREALEFASYDVLEAGDGAQAIACIEKEHARLDVVVTDYSMPRASGIDVITRSQAVDPSLPCIIVTAFRDLDLAMKGMQAGAVGFIPKPFRPEHLLTVVQRALERRQLELEAVQLRVLAPMLERFTMVLANSLESKDFSTQRHSERLVNLSDLVGQRMGLDPNERGRLRLGACLHDIGKVGIPEHILNKAERLLPEEFELMKTHPEIGAQIIENIESWGDVQLIVKHHHEHFDGLGYPHGLKGTDIPLGARIVCVVDAFDVMRSGRVYSPARELDFILEELQTQSGHQFDPEVVEAFLGCFESEQVAAAYTKPGEDPLRAVAPPTANVRGRWLIPNEQPKVPLVPPLG